MSIETLIAQIKPPDIESMAIARAHQDTLTKPQGSLGRLEELSIQIAGITRQSKPQLRYKVVVVMAGDHGVVQEGVSAYPQEVTSQMVSNFLTGGAAINVLSQHVGAHGVIGSTLNFMPGVYRKMIEHLRSGEAEKALKFQERGNRITQIMLELGFVGCMRAVMSKLGFEVGEPRLPNLPLLDEKRDLLFAKLEEAGFQELADL